MPARTRTNRLLASRDQACGAVPRRGAGQHHACAFLPADAAEPVKVGVVGMDNYQAVAYAQLLNSPKAEGDLAGTKVVAAVTLPGRKPANVRFVLK